MRLSIFIFLSLLMFSCKSPLAIVSDVPTPIPIDKMDFYHNSNSTMVKIMEMANNENKLIFVDIYADWCLPCKNMDNDVFSNDETSDFMKANFINYKVDGERFNGLDLGVIFEVGGYPTLLILDKNGRILERNDGALYHRGLVKMSQAAIKKANTSF